MIAVLIIISIILLIALLRFGVAIEYSEAGFKAWIRVGFFSFLIFPTKEVKPKKPKKTKKEPKNMMPGSLNEFLDMLPPIKKMLSRIKRKLLIRRLKIHYTVAGNDPSSVAMMYGAANAGLNLLIPVFENNFKIKHRDIQVSADFETSTQKIYVYLALSIAVWEVIYIASALLPILFKSTPKRSGVNQRKEVKENGQTT